MEKEKNLKIENKLIQKDKLLNQMQVFHNEICQSYEDAQIEYLKAHAREEEKDIEIANLTE